MKYLVLLLTALYAACGSVPEKTAVNTNTNAATVSNVNTSANNNNSTPYNSATINGEKIEKETLVKFDGGKPPEGWTFIDPDGKDAPSAISYSSGTVKLSIPSGKDLYGENRTAPRLLKAIEGDFQIEVRVAFDPKAIYQGAGILVFHDDKNYLRLERGFGGVGGGDNGIRLDARTAEDYTTLTTPAEIPTESKSVDLKIVRSEKLFLAFWRLDENSEWKEVGEFESNYPASIRVGIIGCNTAAPISAEFSGIKLLPFQPKVK